MLMTCFKMNVQDFKEFAKETVDYICDYFDNIRNLTVLSSASPGYLCNQLGNTAPVSGEPWQQVLEDVDNVILPGLTHWHSPNFHAYYPTANSYPAVVADLLISGLGTVSSDWASNPASVELETKMMDWLTKLLGLPNHFLNSSDGPGGGVIQNAASESTLVGLLAAKFRKIKELSETSDTPKRVLETKLVGYTSEQSNSSVEKSGLLGSLPMRLLPTDKKGSLRGDTLINAINKDKENGYIPCYVVATLGTTGTCAFDDLEELANVCREENIWLHVDAAYAGTAFVCPEYRHYMKGVDHVDSFNINPHKWMMINADCSAMWFRNSKEVEEAFRVGEKVLRPPGYPPEIEHWQIPNTRRFRALKIWFVLRIYGVEGIQKHVRKQIYLAEYFKHLVMRDERFEVCTSSMGVVCFRLKGEDKRTQDVLDKLSERKKIFVMPYYHHQKLVIRFVICSRLTEKKDIVYAWREITSQLDIGLHDKEIKNYSDVITNAIDNLEYPHIIG